MLESDECGGFSDAEKQKKKEKFFEKNGTKIGFI
jgi:hypothetical protein